VRSVLTVNYVVRERYASQLCTRVFCPAGQAVVDSHHPSSLLSVAVASQLDCRPAGLR